MTRKSQRPTEPTDAQLKQIADGAGDMAKRAAYQESPGGIDYNIVYRAERRALYRMGRHHGERELRRMKRLASPKKKKRGRRK